MAQLGEPVLHEPEEVATWTPRELLDRPLLPDFGRVDERCLDDCFERWGRLGPGCRVIEVACGRTRWLPYFGHAYGATVVGLESDPEAATFAIANLMGAGARGSIRCCDPFVPAVDSDLLWSFDLAYSLGALPGHDPVACLRLLRRYLAPDGRIVTTTPNARALGNGSARPEPLRTPEGLREAHERAGFRTLDCGYLGFYDERRHALAPETPAWRRALSGAVRHATTAGASTWLRLGLGTLETRWLSPHVVYVGERP